MSGETKYLITGCAVRLVKKLDIGTLVQDVYESGGEEYTDERVYLVDKVYDEAPTAKLDEKKKSLESEIEQLKQLKRDLENGLKVIKQSESERLKKYEKHRSLKYLDMYLDNKITHFVFPRNIGYRAPCILPIEDARCNGNNKWDKDLKLLVLFGSSKGNLEWRINEYKDGSGSYEQVFLCCSYEEALAVMQTHLSSLEHVNEDVIKFAEQHGLVLRKELVDKHRELIFMRQAKEVEELTDKLQKEKQKLEAVTL
jgi:hypothetical protein